MGPLGDPLAQQPRGTHGGAQDSSMSNLQSSRKPDTQWVPCSSTQLTALSPSIVFQARCGYTATNPSGNEQGSFTFSTRVGVVHTQKLMFSEDQPNCPRKASCG